MVVISAVLRAQIPDNQQGFGKRQGAGREAARIRLPRRGHGLGSRLPLDPGCWDQGLSEAMVKLPLHGPKPEETGARPGWAGLITGRGDALAALLAAELGRRTTWGLLGSGFRRSGWQERHVG